MNKMSKNDIQALLLRFRMNECSEEELMRIHHWYTHLNEDFESFLQEEEKEELEAKILQNIWGGIHAKEHLPEGGIASSWWRRYGAYVGLAAAFLLLLLAYVYLDSFTSPNIPAISKTIYIDTPSDKLLLVTNDTKVSKKYVLEDNSTVTLAPGSQIIYPSKFSEDRRVVQLIGDGFFEVSKNADKPFFVYSGSLVTQVLGTSFRIKSHQNAHAMEVEVVTGKVTVFENAKAFDKADLDIEPLKNNNGVILTPNQRVTYFSESRHLLTGLVIEPVRLEVPAEAPQYVFNNDSLDLIMNHLQSEFGIEIVFANEKIGKCTFTGDLSDMPLYEKLDLVCGSNRVFYEIKGTRILIHGPGCE
jgi:transmembrane sensor